VQNQLKVNPLQFNDIVGHSESSLLLEGRRWWEYNELIKIVECSVNDDFPTGRWCLRYVVAYELVKNTSVAERVYRVHFSPFKNARSPLGLSGVRKSDNLESF
jgi:hypothetical protein